MKVLVVGGGIVGLTIARELKKQGAGEIVLLEKGELGRESSFAAAGMLAPQAEADRDDPFFRLCKEARDYYPEFADEILFETEIDIELDREGTLYAAFGEEDEVLLDERFAWQTAAGMDIERLSRTETHRLEPFLSPDTTSSLFFPNDWQVENRILLRALVSSIGKGFVDIHQNTGVECLQIDGDTISGVIDENGKLHEADIVILATGAWTNHIETGREEVRLPAVRPVRGQMISYRTAKRLLNKTIYSHRGYVVPRKDGKLLAGATVEEAGFENRTTEEGIDMVRWNATEIVPGFANLKISESWSGLRPCSADGLPLVGRVQTCRNLYLSTGHYRNGILLAPLTAKHLVNTIFGKQGESLNFFAPSRSSAAAA